jgi:hypothetical protein
MLLRVLAYRLLGLVSGKIIRNDRTRDFRLKKILSSKKNSKFKKRNRIFFEVIFA